MLTCNRKDNAELNHIILHYKSKQLHWDQQQKHHPLILDHTVIINTEEELNLLPLEQKKIKQLLKIQQLLLLQDLGMILVIIKNNHLPLNLQQQLLWLQVQLQEWEVVEVVKQQLRQQCSPWEVDRWGLVIIRLKALTFHLSNLYLLKKIQTLKKSRNWLINYLPQFHKLNNNLSNNNYFLLLDLLRKKELQQQLRQSQQVKIKIQFNHSIQNQQLRFKICQKLMNLSQFNNHNNKFMELHKYMFNNHKS